MLYPTELRALALKRLASAGFAILAVNPHVNQNGTKQKSTAHYGTLTTQSTSHCAGLGEPPEKAF